MDDEQQIDAAGLAALERFTDERGLPEQFGTVFLQWYTGVTAALAKRAGASESPLLVGLSGCQGSGKSTLVDAMARVLADAHDVETTVLSLDDFYLTKAERESLAQRVHPLFATRGVPGTHDLDLLRRTVKALQNGDDIALPVFDKAADDRTTMVRRPHGGAPTQIVLLEGWCVGIPPQPMEALEEPINPTEVDLDPDRIWRTAVNRFLGEEYAALFAEILNLDVFTASTETLNRKVEQEGISIDAPLSRLDYLDLLMTHSIEPRIAGWGLVFVIDFLPEQSALARLIPRQENTVAARFEAYYGGLELANGYWEETQADVLSARFADDNVKRGLRGQEVISADTRLLHALEAGFPNCSGVALGFDRLLMLTLGQSSIAEVMPFGWDRA